MTAGEIPNADQHNLEGSRWVEFVTEVEPEDLIVDTKKRLSAFYPTDLEFLLRNLKKEIVVITGCGSVESARITTGTRPL